MASAGLIAGLGVDPPPQAATVQARAAMSRCSPDGTRVRAVVQLDSTPPLMLMIGRPVDPADPRSHDRTEQAVAEYQRLDQNRSGLQIAFA